ncbi:hypothetical protein HDV05_004435 [Chytridiales sp. JEL 0842]|nr:hypothetical protein HDV05_004435 [Chytridiales sp. JEL 0842]
MGKWTGKEDECDGCKLQKAKYKCPACLFPSCSLACSKSHKDTTGCSGVRCKTNYVPISKYTENDFMSGMRNSVTLAMGIQLNSPRSHLCPDYCFLEDAHRIADNATRQNMKSKPVENSKLSQKQKMLQKQCNARKISIRFAPNGLQRRNSNHSYYNTKTKSIIWTIEWVFESGSTTTFLDHGVSETTTLYDSLDNFLGQAPENANRRLQLADFVKRDRESLHFYLKDGQPQKKMSEVKYQKLLQFNERLKQEDELPRIKVSEAAKAMITFITSTPDPLTQPNRPEFVNENHFTKKQRIKMGKEIVQLLRKQTCYDLLPLSYKLIVLETTLMFNCAQTGSTKGVQSAPLWDATHQKFAGMLTVTDFINLLLYYYSAPEYGKAIQEFEKLSIQAWKGVAPCLKVKSVPY